MMQAAGNGTQLTNPVTRTRRAQPLIEYALSFVGKKVRYDDRTDRKLGDDLYDDIADCSLFSHDIFQKYGMRILSKDDEALPDNRAKTQYLYCHNLNQNLTQNAWQNNLPGDLWFRNETPDNVSPDKPDLFTITHVMVSLSNQWAVELTTSSENVDEQSGCIQCVCLDYKQRLENSGFLELKRPYPNSMRENPSLGLKTYTIYDVADPTPQNIQIRGWCTGGASVVGGSSTDNKLEFFINDRHIAVDWNISGTGMENLNGVADIGNMVYQNAEGQWRFKKVCHCSTFDPATASSANSPYQGTWGIVPSSVSHPNHVTLFYYKPSVAPVTHKWNQKANMPRVICSKSAFPSLYEPRIFSLAQDKTMQGITLGGYLSEEEQNDWNHAIVFGTTTAYSGTEQQRIETFKNELKDLGKFWIIYEMQTPTDIAVVDKLDEQGNSLRIAELNKISLDVGKNVIRAVGSTTYPLLSFDYEQSQKEEINDIVREGALKKALDKMGGCMGGPIVLPEQTGIKYKVSEYTAISMLSGENLETEGSYQIVLGERSDDENNGRHINNVAINGNNIRMRSREKSDNSLIFYPRTGAFRPESSESGYGFLGSANVPWRTVYSMNFNTVNAIASQLYQDGGAISSTDARMLENAAPIENAESLVMALSPRQYRTLNGTSGRLHYGIVSQELKSALTKAGIEDCAAYIRDVGDSGKTQTEAAEEDVRYGVRYEELIAPVIAVVQKLRRELNETKAELASLQAQLRRRE